MTSLQKRTAETPSAQRVKKRTMDAQRSIQVHDAIRKPPLRTLRLGGDMPFLQWTHTIETALLYGEWLQVIFL